MLYRLGMLFYLVSYYLIGIRKQTVLKNLSAAFPHLDATQLKSLAKDFYRHYSEVIAEMVKTFSIDPGMLSECVHFENIELLQDELESGQSVILLASHQCNVDWLMVATQLKLGHTLDVVYKTRHNRYIDKMFIESHQRHGAYPISTKDTARETVKRRNIVRAIALVADLAPRKREEKVWLDFMSLETAFFYGPEKLARMMKYPVYFLGMRRIAHGQYQVTVNLLSHKPQAELPEVITRKYAQLIESEIQHSPSDWLWSHRRWKYRKQP